LTDAGVEFDLQARHDEKKVRIVELPATERYIYNLHRECD